MVAWLEVVEAGDSGRVPGERLRLSQEQSFLSMLAGVLVLHDEYPRGALGLATIHRVGQTHVLRWIRGPQQDVEVILRPSMSVSPLPGVTLRYGSDVADVPLVDLGVPVDGWRDLLLFAPGDFASQTWRCVPRDDPAAPPRRLVFVSADDLEADEGWQGDAFQQVCAAPPCATRVLAHHPFENVLITEDTAGVTFDDIIEASLAQGAALDPSVLFAILGPVARVLGSARLRADADPWNIHVTFDGRVCFDGFLVPWLPVAAWPSLSLVEIAENFVAGGLLGPPVPRPETVPFEIDDASDGDDGDVVARRERAHRLFALAERARTMAPELGALIVEVLEGSQPPLDRQVFADAVERWGRQLPPATPAALVDLVRGLFPARFSAEEQLREQLAMLSPADVAALIDRS